GASVSSPEEALLAEKEGADYISAQSIFRTSSKENVKIIGLEGLRSIVNASSLPVIAIGGINKDNVKDVIRNGAKGIAVISAVVSKEDVKKAVEELRESLEEVL
ncbi:MAG TPA: thiamine phosphate synthase, partial [bacterium]|nr:thiamine phosphate synthase [bacterium]